MSLFDRFSPVLRGNHAPKLRDPNLLIDRSGKLEIYYVPFEYVNRLARIVLVGITPGPTQMVNGNNEAYRALLEGKSGEEVMRLAKDTAAFSGEPLRGNLVKQLNYWGIPGWLNLKDSAELFSTSRHLVQTTSLLRYPVFVGGENYRGNPNMLSDPMLKRYVHEFFVPEVLELKNAVFFGLGPQVQKVLDALVEHGTLDSGQIMSGLLHPSGNNTYRISYLVGPREAAVPHQTNPTSFDRGRRQFRARYLGT